MKKIIMITAITLISFSAQAADYIEQMRVQQQERQQQAEQQRQIERQEQQINQIRQQQIHQQIQQENQWRSQNNVGTSNNNWQKVAPPRF